MTANDVYGIVKESNKRIDSFIAKQVEFNGKISNLVARHDEKIKGLWRIPVISGGVVAFLVALGVFISQILG